MKKLLLFALMTLSTLFSACLFEDDEEEWDAAKVCPEAGTNAYGDPNRGTFVDERDGRVYKYTTIGDQVWMAENLKFELPYPYSLCYGMEVCKEEWWEDTTCTRDTTHLAEIAQRMQSTCTDNDCIAAEWCEKVGRCYSLMDGDLMNNPLVDTLCPKGWHLPSKQEWDVMFDEMGRKKDGDFYKRLESRNMQIFDGSDECGFSVMPADVVYSEFFAYFWTSTVMRLGIPNGIDFGKNTYSSNYELYRKSPRVRCVKDD